MGRMQDSLRDLVRQVQDAAGNISTASSEIASAQPRPEPPHRADGASLEETRR